MPRTNAKLLAQENKLRHEREVIRVKENHRMWVSESLDKGLIKYINNIWVGEPLYIGIAVNRYSLTEAELHAIGFQKAEEYSTDGFLVQFHPTKDYLYRIFVSSSERLLRFTIKYSE